MMTRVIAALVAVVLVAGCGDSSPATSSPSSSSSSVAPSFSSSVAPSFSSSAAPESISGRLVAGVEANCLLLEGTGKPHLLIFADPALKAKAKIGDVVTVVGTARPAQMTTCQQGIPFFVTALSPGPLGA